MSRPDLACLLAALARKLQTLDPPSPTASPGTCDLWHAITVAGNDVALELDRLLPARRESPAPLPTPQPSTSPAPQPAQDHDQEPATGRSHAQRAARIAAALEQGPLPPPALVALVSGSAYTHGSRAHLEEQALSNLSRGYQYTSGTPWRQLLGPLADAPPSLADMQTESEELAAIVNPSARLLQRHQYLAGLEASATGSSWVRHVLVQIEALRFALEWHALPKSAKSQFYLAHYAAHHEHARAQPNLRTYVNTQARADFRRWRRNKLEPSVTGRNRLWALYQLFGAAVLADTTWNVPDLGASRSFASILNRLVPLLCAEHTASDTDDDDVSPLAAALGPRHRASMRTTARVLSVIADADTATAFARFVRENPPPHVLPALV